LKKEFKIDIGLDIAASSFYKRKKYKYEKIKRELCKKHNLLPKQFPSQSYFYELIRKQFPPKL